MKIASSSLPTVSGHSWLTNVPRLLRCFLLTLLHGGFEKS